MKRTGQPELRHFPGHAGRGRNRAVQADRFLGVLLCLLCATAGAAELLDRIAVTVGNDVITEGDVYDEIRVTSFLNGTWPDLSLAAKRQAADRLVDQGLVRREMNLSREPPPAPQDAEKVIDELKQKRFHGDDAAYRKALRQYGISDQELHDHVLWQIAAVRFTNDRFGSATQKDGVSPPPNVERQLDAWLKQARAQTPIDYRREAFQ